MDLESWPHCAIDGCPAKSCLALRSPYCFPHSVATVARASSPTAAQYVEATLRLVIEMSHGKTRHPDDPRPAQ